MPQRHGHVAVATGGAGFVAIKDHEFVLAKDVDDIAAVHNKSFNPSGVPYKGEKRPVSEVQGANPEEEARAKVYGPEVDGPKSAADFAASSALSGIASDHEFYVKHGKLYVHGLHDCVVSGTQPLLLLWGEYIFGKDKKKEITKFKSQHYMWEMNSPDFVATFDTGGDKGNDDTTLSKNGKPNLDRVFGRPRGQRQGEHQD